MQDGGVEEMQVTLADCLQDSLRTGLSEGVVGEQLKLYDADGNLVLGGAGGGEVLVSWPARFTNYALQASTTLTTGSWTNVPSTTNRVSFVPGNRQMFRLMRVP